MSKVYVGVSVLVLLQFGSSSVSAQSASSRFVGAWTLVSWVATDSAGNEGYPHGPNPIGQLVYTESGRMGVHQMNPRAELPDVSGLTPIEAARRLISVFAAYYGTYTVDESAGTVTHHVEGISDPTLVGTDQMRQFEFINNDRLQLIAVADNEALREIGAAGSNVLIWERVH